MVGVLGFDCIQCSKNEIRRDVMKTTAGSFALPHSGGKREDEWGCSRITVNFVVYLFPFSLGLAKQTNNT